jgi:hypothetical protein
MSARGLKKLFDQTWEIAQQQKPSSSDGKDLFDTLFGGKMR